MLDDLSGPVVGWRFWAIRGNGKLIEYNSALHRETDIPPSGILGVCIYEDDGGRLPLIEYRRYFVFRGPEGWFIGANDDNEEDVERRYPGALVFTGGFLASDYDRANFKWMVSDATFCP